MCVYVFVSERQIDKHTKRERGEGGRERDRQTERETERYRGQTGGQVSRQRG